MHTLAAGMAFTDLMFRGKPRIIASGILQGAGGVAIVDPGPTSTLPTLLASLSTAGISPGDITDLLLTHIHLDHAGAAGTLVREHSRIRVHVHERGAPHLVDPSKLVASAGRLYGDAMDRLWGEILPVPEGALSVLRGGEQIDIAGRRLEVAYTPGHASHHVSYFSRDTGVAFVGDTAGVQIVTGGMIVPPTPPPDIDLELWRGSLAVVGQWHASSLLISHFGVVSSPSAHLATFGHQLEMVGRLGQQSLSLDGDDDGRAAWFMEEMRLELRRQMSESDAAAYEIAGRFDLNWRGLARYWRKRESSH